MSAENTTDAAPHAETEQQHVTVAESHPRQVSPPPSDGNEVSAEQIKKPSEINRGDPNTNVVEIPPQSPTFKEQVYGYARLIRGTVLGQSDVKEQGAQVLRGEQGIPKRRDSQSNK